MTGVGNLGEKFAIKIINDFSKLLTISCSQKNFKNYCLDRQTDTHTHTLTNTTKNNMTFVMLSLCGS